MIPDFITQKNNLRGNIAWVKEIEISFFDGSSFNETGVEHKIFYFNPTGQIAEIHSMYGDEMNGKFSFTYHTNGAVERKTFTDFKLEKQELFNANGFLLEWLQKTKTDIIHKLYNADGNVFKRTENNEVLMETEPLPEKVTAAIIAGTCRTEKKENNDGSYFELNRYYYYRNEAFELNYIERKYFDKAGRLKEMEEFDTEQDLEQHLFVNKFIFIDNEFDDVVVSREFYRDNDAVISKESFYKKQGYDHVGNWTENHVYTNDGTKEQLEKIVKREFKYRE